ncbi:cubilin-like [Lytechinus variegatus]|uniref:cubilin-like n=1 Tax=Lytechinus variegatus TaxID=7654 RepID=UPI001BB2B1D7|nr:cubilin-like [Lytechinus variegatus]
MASLFSVICLVFLIPCVTSSIVQPIRWTSKSVRPDSVTSIQSPSYWSYYRNKYYYYNNLNKGWIVSAPPEYRLRLTFYLFETEKNRDYVYVRDGWTSDYSRSTRVASLSGDSIPEDITSYGSYLWIQFLSDSQNAFRGFQAQLTAQVRSIHLLDGGSELLQSPNHPGNYYNNLNVRWFVSAPPAYRLRLQFISFSISWGDNVIVSDGWTSDFSSSTELENLSGTSLPVDIISNGSYLWLQFTTNTRQSTSTGFMANLTAEMRSFTIIDLTAEPETSLNSNDYPEDGDILVNITSPANSQIQLYITFDPTQTNHGNDGVYVYEGWTLNQVVPTQRWDLSATSFPVNITSQGSYMWVQFNRNAGKRRDIFQVVASSQIRTISLQAGNVRYIQSPNYPSNYTNKTHVRWLVSVPSPYQVRLRFTHFSTEKNCDFVHVRDGLTSDYSRSTQVTSLSGLNPDDIVSRGSYLWVNFTSDDWVTSTGFEAQLTTFRNISLQPWNHESIQSPNYPYPYFNNINIRWFVNVPSQYQVRLHFTSFSTQENHDFVRVRDGGTSDYSSSTRVASLSGDSIPDDIISNGSHLWVQFASDHLINATGFVAQLAPIQNRHINLEPWESVSIESPDFPANYSNNVTIRWLVSIPSLHQLRLHFTSFSTEKDHDFVNVSEGVTEDFSSSTQLASLSGDVRPDDIVSRGSYLWLQFTSDEHNVDTGFNVRLTMFRDVRINLQPWNHTSIQSPVYSYSRSPYDSSVNIRWLVSVPSPYQVRVNFTSFSTEKDHYFVYVSDGWTPDYSNSTRVASLSEDLIPDDVISRGSYLWIEFTSDDGNRYNTGFQARLTPFRTIHLKVGKVAVIQSPNHPHLYYNDLNIRWFVSVPPAYQVRLHFNNFSTEEDHDFVIVNDGWTSNYTSSAERGRLSGSINPGDIVSNGSYLWVEFTTDDQGRSNGFRVLLTTELRSIHLQDGESRTFESPNCPNHYYNNLNVTWLVSVPPAYKVRLHFISSTSSNDFVRVRDGWTSDYSSSTERRNLSGSIDPGDIVSNGSYLWVQFTTNDQRRSQGFRALLTTELRSLHLQDGKSRTIESPNYPNHYYNSLNVSWSVSVPPAYQVRLHFSSFQTESNKDFVKVRDGWTSDYSSSTQLASLSGDSSPDDIISRGSYLWVYFTSDDERNFSGFTVNITTELRTIQLNTTGEAVLTSPDSPDNGDYSINVTWFVVAPSPYRVGISFSDFSSLENGDLVTLREGWTSNYSHSTLRESLSMFSASSSSTDIASVGSYLWIQFTTLPQNKITVFRASLFVVIPVIYVDTAKTESLKSPNYPAQYHNSLDLMWQVIAPENHQVSLHFVDLEIEQSRDILYLFEGQSPEFEMSEMVRPNISGSDLPQNITSVGSFLWIRFTSDGASEGTYRGFNIMLIANRIPG